MEDDAAESAPPQDAAAAPSETDLVVIATESAPPQEAAAAPSETDLVVVDSQEGENDGEPAPLEDSQAVHNEEPPEPLQDSIKKLQEQLACMKKQQSAKTLVRKGDRSLCRTRAQKASVDARDGEGGHAWR